MPIYAYRCQDCGFEKDQLQKLSDAPLTVCPSCNGNGFARKLTAPAFQLKGSGWYATDFRDGGQKKAEPEGSEAAGDKASDKPAGADTNAASESAKSDGASASSPAAGAQANKPADSGAAATGSAASPPAPKAASPSSSGASA
jgi:putative FmdB family regulatory protein